MMSIFIVPLPFIFVLLVLLLVKAPKAGAWVVAGVILAVLLGAAVLLPLASQRGGGPGVSFGGLGLLPLVVVPLPFIFVLMLLLLTKAPKVGAGLIVAIVLMVLVGLFLRPVALRRRVAYEQPTDSFVVHPSRVVTRQQTEPGVGLTIVGDTAVHEILEGTPGAVVGPVSRGPAVASPIWSDGVENEFDADVYPSKLTAVRALGSRMEALVQQAVGMDAVPEKISIFQESNERELVSELSNSLQDAFSDAKCFVEGELRNTSDGEVGITLRLADLRIEPTSWGRARGDAVGSGRMEATVFGKGGTMTVGCRFAEKPWMVDFASFTNSQRGNFVVARSRQACTSENDAQQQALQDASVLLTGMIGEMRRGEREPLESVVQVTSTDVLDGDLIVDQFVQSFAGSAGRIWRGALLIDASAQELRWLADRKSLAARSIRMTWARMIGSVTGVLVLIGVIYFFLNMATRGYYEWSLRIAGIILAIIGAVSILMVIH